LPARLQLVRAEAGKRIVFGVDGSPASRTALEWAGDEAIHHGSDLVVLTTWLPIPPPLAGTSSTLPTHGVTHPGESAIEQLMETIRDVLGEDPPVLVQPQVKEGSAAKVLIDLSEEADLLVVGARGHGGFAGMLLGSVSQHVAAHAKCTVVVVR
jgi:nucleotide-binding universal stress UspA family protein